MLSGPMCVEVQDFFQWVYLSLEVDDQYSYYDGPKNAQAPYRASYKGQDQIAVEQRKLKLKLKIISFLPAKHQLSLFLGLWNVE